MTRVKVMDVRPSRGPTWKGPPATGTPNVGPNVAVLISTFPLLIVPEAEPAEPVVRMLPTTSTGSPCVKSIPLNAKAYWPVPTVLVVRDAEEYRTVTVDVPELAPAAALIVTVPPVGGESGAV